MSVLKLLNLAANVNNTNSSKLKMAVESLSPKKKEIATLLFGLDGSEPKSVHEVANILCIDVADVQSALDELMQEIRKILKED